MFGLLLTCPAETEEAGTMADSGTGLAGDDEEARERRRERADPGVGPPALASEVVGSDRSGRIWQMAASSGRAGGARRPAGAQGEAR